MVVDAKNRCECGEAIKVGDRVVRNVDGGFLHLECVGGWFDVDGNPIAARPEGVGPHWQPGFIWSAKDEAMP
jgi:hypothetical protein